MNSTIKLLIACIIVFVYGKANAQYMQDVNGKAMPSKNYVNVEGSPYLTDDWVKGDIMLANGRNYNDVSLKYDMSDGQLYYQTKPEETLVFIDLVKEFKVPVMVNSKKIEKLFRSGYPAVTGGTEKSFYEVVGDGKTQLLKQNIKTISEYKEYNSSTITKKFDDNIKYFLFTNGKLIPVKKDKKSILTAIGDKQPEMEAYIKTNNLNLKNDEDAAKLIIYYNSL